MGSLLIIRVILLFSNIGDALYCWGVECHENQQYQRFVRHKVIRFKSLCITDFGNASYLTLKPGQALQVAPRPISPATFICSKEMSSIPLGYFAS